MSEEATLFFGWPNMFLPATYSGKSGFTKCCKKESGSILPSSQDSSKNLWIAMIIYLWYSDNRSTFSSYSCDSIGSLREDKDALDGFFDNVEFLIGLKVTWGLDMLF